MLKEFFNSEKIEYFAAIRLDERLIVNRDKLNRLTVGIGAANDVAMSDAASAGCGDAEGAAIAEGAASDVAMSDAAVAEGVASDVVASGATDAESAPSLADVQPLVAVVFLCPYYQGENVRGNISRYAFARDYHIYFKKLFERLSVFAEKNGKHLKFAGFSDNSPLSEVRLAASTGLGVIGNNGLLINEKYGSYIFIGEIVLAERDAEDLLTEAKAIRSCEDCGKCLNECPTMALSGNSERCLSYLSQRKKITDDEAELLRKNSCLWGCDKCQEVCPMNSKVAISPIPFFGDNLTFELTRKLLGNKEDFRERLGERAFSWRGYDVLKRNLDIIENADK